MDTTAGDYGAAAGADDSVDAAGQFTGADSRQSGAFGSVHRKYRVGDLSRRELRLG